MANQTFSMAAIRRRVCRARERGASAVEFALLFPLFFMVTMATFTGAQAFNQRNQLTHATREGARYAATVPTSAFATGPLWAANVASRTRNSAYGDLDATAGIDGKICIALVLGTFGDPDFIVTDAASNPFLYEDTGPGAPTCPFDDGISDTSSRRVQVTATRSGYISGALWRMDLTIPSEAVSRHEEALS